MASVGKLFMSVLNLSSLRMFHKNSEGSFIVPDNFLALSRSYPSRSSGYSRLIIIAQVGLIARTLLPCSTNGIRISRLCFALARNVFKSPCSHAGIPQHVNPFTQAQSTSFFSSTSIVSVSYTHLTLPTKRIV